MFMIEYQILTRLNTTVLKRKGKDRQLYGNCQVCNDKYGQLCIEASLSNNSKKHTVFIFCSDCHSALNDISAVFIYKKKIYTYEDSYHISENPIKLKTKWYCNKYYMEPIWRTNS